MKSELFNKELDFIENEKIKNFTKIAIERLPDYFFEVAASSTGKYHPSYALGEGGLVRHTKAAVRFANHMLQLEQNKEKFNEIERSCIISALILHDGWKHGKDGSKFTTHEHPKVCADWIMQDEGLNGLLPENERKLISSAIASHMGEWNTNKKSKTILQKPETDIQKFVHTCDYLASRKDIEVLFDSNSGSASKQTENKRDIKEYKMPFGKYKGQLITKIAKEHKDYLQWMAANLIMQEPLNTFVYQLLA